MEELIKHLCACVSAGRVLGDRLVSRHVEMSRDHAGMNNMEGVSSQLLQAMSYCLQNISRCERQTAGRVNGLLCLHALSEAMCLSDMM